MSLFQTLTITFQLVFSHNENYYMKDTVKEHFLNMLADDECTTSWPDVQNCVNWWNDIDAGLKYVLTNDIPPYYVAPYCPFGVGKGYCLNGTTTCPEFYGLVCPAQTDAPPTGDVEVPQIQLYSFPLNPDPTDATLPLNLYQKNPLQWYYDSWHKKEIIVNHKQDKIIPFQETDIFNIFNSITFPQNNTPNVSNPGFQTTGVHLAGMQIKGPAEAEGHSVDAGGIPLICGGHVTPPVAVPCMFHYHKASFCLMESSYKQLKKKIKNGTGIIISEEFVMSSFEKGIDNSTHSDLVGFANDGQGIYGFYDIGGIAPLVDQCNGHFGCLDDSCQDVSYHYHAFNVTYVPPKTFHPYWTGCLGPSKGICNETVHKQYDNGASWCGVGCGYEICVQNGTNHNALNKYIGSFGDPNWLKQFTVNPF